MMAEQKQWFHLRYEDAGRISGIIATEDFVADSELLDGDPLSSDSRVVAIFGVQGDANLAAHWSRVGPKLLAWIKENGRRGHYECDDRWYSCPKAPDGCANDMAGDECLCGADKFNAEVDALIAEAEAEDKEQP
jgi:hypothetical protein